MHELSFCERIVDLMEWELAQLHPPPLGVASVRLVVGQLHQIVESVLRDAYMSLTAGGIAAGSTLEVTSAPAVGACPACGWRGELRIPWFCCACCGSFELEVVGGKELYLESIEVIEEEVRP